MGSSSLRNWKLEDLGDMRTSDDVVFRSDWRSEKEDIAALRSIIKGVWNALDTLTELFDSSALC